jgi:hypothetical protein
LDSFLIAIGVEPECRSVARSLSGCGPKEESDAPIVAESEIMDLLKRLKLIRWSDLSMIAIGVEPEYISLARSLSRWGPKGESNAPITTESEVIDFLRRLKLIRRSDSSMLAIEAESEYRSIARSLYGWDPKGDLNAPITVETLL